MTQEKKQMEVEYPDFAATFTVRLLTEKNPELCNLLWNNLPIETIESHAMASGELMFASHTIVAVVKPHVELMTEVPVGTLHMSTCGYLTLSFIYGEITEPEPSNPVGQVREDQLEELKRVGREVFYSNFFTHEPIRVIFRKKC